ncbi:MAG: substrate-binding domain-containing protein [Clostridia bacterium]|nr:substrate-binding domain-containing protein [Clostridia bacterium]
MKKICLFSVFVLALCILFAGYSFAELWDRIDGSTATLPLSEAILMYHLDIDSVQASGRIVHSKTYDAYRGLLSGERDLIFVPLPEQGELEAIAQGLAESSAEPFQMPELTYEPIVKEGLVFIVNTANPINELSAEQLKGIYSGQIKNWSEVGGGDVAIRPFQRNSDSGSQTAFLQLLMKDTKPQSAVASLTYDSMWYLVERIAAYDNQESAIGYSMYFYVTQMVGNENIRLLAVDGVVPSEETIASGAYPLVTGYYAVYRSDLAEDHPARKLVDWLVSEEGQEVVARAGYVPLSVASFEQNAQDAQLTIASSGTGGSRQDTPVQRYLGRMEAWADEDEAFWYRTYDLLDDWEAKENLAWKSQSHFTSVVDGRLLQHVVWDLKRSDYLPSAWRVHSVIFDMDSWEKISLSDLFYDEFDYVRYINEQAALALFEHPWKGAEYTPVVEQMLRRPFGGFPYDYPHFRIVEGDFGGRELELLIDYESPLFATNLTYDYTAIRIPLPDTVSPYGAPWANVTIDTSDSPLHIARITLPEGKDPRIAEQINAGLSKAGQQALAHPMVQAGAEYSVPLVPRVRLNEKYLTVRYIGNEGYREGDQATLVAATFDIETGKSIDGMELWKIGMKLADQKGISDDLGLWSAPLSLYKEPIDAHFTSGYSDEAYEMPPLSRMVYIGCRAWYYYEDLRFTIVYFDPEENAEHQMNVSLKLLQEQGLFQ